MMSNPSFNSGPVNGGGFGQILGVIFFWLLMGLAFFACAIPAWLLVNLLSVVLYPFGFRPLPWGIWNLVISLFVVLGFAMITQPPLAAAIGIPLGLIVLRLRAQKYIEEEGADIAF